MCTNLATRTQEEKTIGRIAHARIDEMPPSYVFGTLDRNSPYFGAVLMSAASLKDSKVAPDIEAYVIANLEYYEKIYIYSNNFQRQVCLSLL